jgi:hypothetical protein
MRYALSLQELRAFLIWLMQKEEKFFGGAGGRISIHILVQLL